MDKRRTQGEMIMATEFHLLHRRLFTNPEIREDEVEKGEDFFYRGEGRQARAKKSKKKQEEDKSKKSFF